MLPYGTKDRIDPRHLYCQLIHTHGNTSGQVSDLSMGLASKRAGGGSLFLEDNKSPWHVMHFKQNDREVAIVLRLYRVSLSIVSSLALDHQIHVLPWLWRTSKVGCQLIF